MRKLAALLVAAGLILAGPVAYAQETQAQVPAQPLTLEQQVQELRAEVSALKAEVAALKALLDQLLKPTQATTITPTQPPAGAVGYSRANPAPIGTTLTITKEDILETYTAKVTLLEVVRGDKAWEMVKQANLFNSPPPDGYEYLLARIKFELVAMKDPQAKHDVHFVHFTLVSGQGADYEPVLTAVPPAPALTASLYQGASHEGWAVFKVKKDDASPLITFGRDYQGRGGIWFKTSQ